MGLGKEEGGKFLPEGGEGFGDDFGIAYGDVGVANGCHGEGHGHAVVVAGVDGEEGRCGKVAAPAECRLAVDGGAVAEFEDFAGKGGDAIAFLFGKGVEAGEVEGDAAHAAGDREGEGDVGHVAEAGVEAVGCGGGCLDEDAILGFLGLDADFFPEVDLLGVALHGDELETGEEDFPLSGDGKEFVEVGGCRPVFLDVEGFGRVLAGVELVGFAAVEGRVAEMAHDLEGHLDVGKGEDGGSDGDGESVPDVGGNHEEGGDELAADGAFEGEGRSVEFASPDEDGEMAFFVRVGDVGA